MNIETKQMFFLKSEGGRANGKGDTMTRITAKN